MVQISIEKLYRGEGNGEKYGILGQVMKNFPTNGHPAECDERTWIEMLIVKYTLLTTEKMKKEGDFVSGITDMESLSCYAEGKENENT